MSCNTPDCQQGLLLLQFSDCYRENTDIRVTGQWVGFGKGRPMRINIDDDLCEFHGQCAAVAPEVFELTDDAVVYERDVSPEQEGPVRTAAKVCPQLAIQVTPA